MKSMRRKQFKRICIAGSALLVMAMSLPSIGYAAEEGYTMSLRPSSETVSPGETIQLAVQVHNDGWPDVGEAQVAAFQATLDYDRNSLEYVSVEVPEGTMGDFSPDSGIVLGYGEGHSFQETLDCAVLTMKVSENASGDIPVTIKNVILGKQDATELKASAGETLTLKAGGDVAEDSASEASEGNAVTGTDSSTRENGNGSTNGNRKAVTGQTGSGQKATSGQDSTKKNSKKTKNSDNGNGSDQGENNSSSAAGEKKNSSQATGTKNRSNKDVQSATNNPENTGSTTTTGSSASSNGENGSGNGQSSNEATSHSGMKTAGIATGGVAAAAAAAGGFLFYRKRR